MFTPTFYSIILKKLNKMPKFIVVLISWKKNLVLNMVSVARYTVQQMTDNPNFPIPAVSLETLTSAANRAETAYGNRKNGPAGKMENINAAADLDGLLHLQADYVSTIAGGNETIIVSAGFQATKSSRTPAVIPATPGAPKIKTISGNALQIMLDKVAGADSYAYAIFFGEPTEIEVADNHFVIPVTTAPFFIINDGGAREEIRSIAPGTKFSVQALAQNTAGKSQWGPLVTAFAA